MSVGIVWEVCVCLFADEEAGTNQLGDLDVEIWECHSGHMLWQKEIWRQHIVLLQRDY